MSSSDKISLVQRRIDAQEPRKNEVIANVVKYLADALLTHVGGGFSTNEVTTTFGVNKQGWEPIYVIDNVNMIQDRLREKFFEPINVSASPALGNPGYIKFVVKFDVDPPMEHQ